MGTRARLMPMLRARRSRVSRFFDDVLKGGSVGKRVLMKL